MPDIWGEMTRTQQTTQKAALGRDDQAAKEGEVAAAAHGLVAPPNHQRAERAQYWWWCGVAWRVEVKFQKRGFWDTEPTRNHHQCCAREKR